jgi:hypothetical protein
MTRSEINSLLKGKNTILYVRKNHIKADVDSRIIKKALVGEIRSSKTIVENNSFEGTYLEAFSN